MKENRPELPRAQFFTFICSQKRLEEAEEEINRLGGIIFHPETYGTNGSYTINSGEKVIVLEGVLVAGIISERKINHLLIGLVDKGIAGHSEGIPLFHKRVELTKEKKYS